MNLSNKYLRNSHKFFIKQINSINSNIITMQANLNLTLVSKMTYILFLINLYKSSYTYSYFRIS